MRIAVLHTDQSEADLIVQVLQSAGHACRIWKDIPAALAEPEVREADLLILDGQTAESFEGLLAKIHHHRVPAAPMLLLGNRNGEDSILAALQSGVDDYLIRPIRRGELATRVRVLLRKAYPDQDAVPDFSFDSYTFEVQAKRLTLAGAPIGVTQKEFELALLFFQNLGRPLSRAYIREAIWAAHRDLPTRTIDTHVSRVRSKLGLRPENGYQLIPVYSYGYRLEQLDAKRNRSEERFSAIPQ